MKSYLFNFFKTTSEEAELEIEAESENEAFAEAEDAVAFGKGVLEWTILSTEPAEIELVEYHDL